MPTKLDEKRGVLDAKRNELAEIFKKYPNLDMDVKVAADMKALNDEMTDLGKEVDELKNLSDIEEKNRAAIEEGKQRGSGLPLHQGNSQADYQPKERKSIGKMFVESKAFTEFSSDSKKGPAAEINAESFFERKTLDETGYVPEATRLPGIVPGVLSRPVVADLIPQGITSQYAVPYMEETTTTNNAAPKNENDGDAESVLAFTEKTAAVEEISTFLAISARLMEDVPAVKAYVDSRLSIFLQLAEENQLLNGNGAPPQLRGILAGVGLQTQAKGADATPDAVYKAMTLIQKNSMLSANGVVMHPTDWEAIALLKTTEGIYIWGSPSGAVPERIWGLAVVKTTTIAENTGLVGAFDMACQIFRRKGITFEVSNSHSDFFIKGKMAIRCTERVALANYRPSGFCTVTGI